MTGSKKKKDKNNPNNNVKKEKGSKNESSEGKEEKKKSDRFNVCIRVRPLSKSEKSRGWPSVVSVIDEKMVILKTPTTDRNDTLRQNRGQEKKYVFDCAFDENSSQGEVYEATTKELVEYVLEGYNATVFAYGPTGSGKTYTMVGTEDQPGIMIRALRELFQKVDDNAEELEYEVCMSYLEIYNENIRDLLNPGSGFLDLREDARKGTIEVSGLQFLQIQSTEKVMKHLQKGNKERTVEPTAVNQTSSRSHALLQVHVKASPKNKDINGEVKCGRIFMIDLAGSERATQTKNQGQRLKEGAAINRSLLALGNCINTLSSEGGAKYVNFRDSKLTRLLKDALTGKCKTVMIAHVSPGAAVREETKNTLLYANRAKNIKQNAKSNVMDVSYHVSQYQTIISDLQGEIKRLREKIDESDNQQSAQVNQKPTKESQEELDKLKKDLEVTFEEQMMLRLVPVPERKVGIEVSTNDEVWCITEAFQFEFATSWPTFRSRHRLMEIENNILALTMEFEEQNRIVAEWLNEKAKRDRRQGEEGDTSNRRLSEDSRNGDSDADEPEEVTEAWDELTFIQKEQERYDSMRKTVMKDLATCQRAAELLEEELPNKINSDEQRELLRYLCKVHELEIEKAEMQSNALIKEHMIRKKELLILRYDRQRDLCDEIIARQQRLIEGSSIGMPKELSQLYDLYSQELRGNNVLAGQSNIRRSSSAMSMAPSSDGEGGAFPPIQGADSKENEPLFIKKRRHSLATPPNFGDSPVDMQNSLNSARSVPTPSRLPPLPHLGQSPRSPESEAMRTGVGNISSVAHRRKRTMISNSHHTNSAPVEGKRKQGPRSDILKHQYNSVLDFSPPTSSDDKHSGGSLSVRRRSRSLTPLPNIKRPAQDDRRNATKRSKSKQRK